VPATSFLTIGILVLTPESFELSVNDLYTSARTAIEAETVLSVAPVDLFSESVRQVAIRRCAGDAKCFLSQFEQSGVPVDLLLTISVARLDERLLLGLRLISAKAAVELAAGGGEIAWDLPLARVMESELARIFPRDVWGRISFVEVRAEPAGAEVKMAGRSCRAPCRIGRLAPGPHEVIVERQGFSTHRAQVEAIAKTGAVLEVKLLPLPEPEGELYESPIFWVAAGALVVGSVAAIAVLSAGENGDLVCIYPDLSACPK
jgi:hypothetical protein